MAVSFADLMTYAEKDIALWCRTMNHLFRLSRPLISALLLIVPMLSLAATSPADPIATRKALAALIASSSELIPKTSTCQGDYGQTGNPRVRDLLAMQLAYLYAGDNTIEGHCDAGFCLVTINHSAGEDVSSATIEFSVRSGRANTASMRCVITP